MTAMHGLINEIMEKLTQDAARPTNTANTGGSANSLTLLCMIRCGS